MLKSSRSFEETVKARAERDPAFRDALLTEAADQLLAGDITVGKALLRTVQEPSGVQLSVAVGR